MELNNNLDYLKLMIKVIATIMCAYASAEILKYLATT